VKILTDTSPLRMPRFSRAERFVASGELASAHSCSTSAARNAATWYASERTGKCRGSLSCARSPLTREPDVF
jgi:hypothetical protein